MKTFITVLFWGVTFCALSIIPFVIFVLSIGSDGIMGFLISVLCELIAVIVFFKYVGFIEKRLYINNVHHYFDRLTDIYAKREGLKDGDLYRLWDKLDDRLEAWLKSHDAIYYKEKYRWTCDGENFVGLSSCQLSAWLFNDFNDLHGKDAFSASDSLENVRCVGIYKGRNYKESLYAYLKTWF